MGRIRVIIGSSTSAWDEGVRRELDAVRSASTVVEVVHFPEGPASIENAIDEARATVPTLEEVIRAEREGCDGAMIYCFGDPGLRAAKAAVSIPVVGLGEASCHFAAMMGGRFGIITAGPPGRGTERIIRDNLALAELSHKCVGVRTIGIPVLGLGGDDGEELARVVSIGAALVEQGAEVLVLGCGSILGVDEALRRQLGVPVVVPAAVALLVCESLIRLRERENRA